MKNHKTNKMNNRTINKPAPDPVALLLRDEMIYQIDQFLGAEFEDRSEIASKTLFNINGYPAGLSGCDGAEKYDVFLLERDTRMRRDDPDKHGRMSCSILCQDRDTHMPAYYVQAVIMPSDVAMVTVYTMDEKGNDYRRVVRWSSDRRA